MRCRRSTSFARTISSAGIALLAAAAILILPLDAAAQAGLRGVVLDSQGGTIPGAQVSIEGSNAATVTDVAGVFRLQRIPRGSVTLNVRRLGYRPGQAIIQHAGATETAVEVRLIAVPEVLPTVEVRRRGDISDSRLAGYNARREKRVGHFVTRDQLDRRDSPRFADVLRGVPGVVVRPLRGSGGGRTVSMRGNCSPLVFFDGFPAAAGPMDLDMVDLSTVEGIEIYSSLATIPVEFMSVAGTERCGVIAIWSRTARPRQRRLAEARAGELDRQMASKTVYTAEQVDNAAILAPGTVKPVYPDSLWRAGVGGRVVAEFIVGVDGIIEQGTFGVASTTHPQFSASVRSALETAVFRSATLAGRRVRQLVQVPFVFDPAEDRPAGTGQP
ncbi:MAG TPA: carboxypeptidase regulatory-like domain-containing protein [Gemmatimonadaceae bacterium]|nr:carboxypeptidase regulatory-like domain-containing protein [Gemmatimonadaceae bacterium]